MGDEVKIVQGSDGRWLIVSRKILERGYDPLTDPGQYDTKEDAEKQVRVLIEEETNFERRHGYSAERQQEADSRDLHVSDHLKATTHEFHNYEDFEELFDHLVDEHDVLARKQIHVH